MKFLIDPVYTAKPSTCSTSYLVKQVIKHFSKKDNAYFYLMFPEKYLDDKDELAFYKDLEDRVTLVPYPYVHQDRMEEMYKFTDPLRSLITPGESKYWDVDVILSSRIPQMQNFRVNTGRTANFGKGSYQCLVGLEEMPIFSFRKTVAWGNSGFVDMQSLAAYQAADAIVVNNLWTKDNVLKVARNWVKPSKVLEMKDNIHEVVPVELERLIVKPKPVKDTLNVVFCGRMTGTRNFKEVAELFRKHFSYPLGKETPVRFIVSTHSESTGSIKVGEIDFVEFQKNNREQFHKLLKEEAHIVVNLSTVEDFSLSTYEPLKFGVPVIVPNKDWTSFLGDAYPFRMKSFAESYGIIKSFANDYEGTYKHFVEWEKSVWKDLVDSPVNVPTSYALEVIVEDYCNAVIDKFNNSNAFAKYRDFVKQVKNYKGSLDALAEAKKLGIIMDKDDWSGIPVGKRTSFYPLKVLLNMDGWVDTKEPGVFLHSSAIK